MTNSEFGNGGEATRDDLVQRLALMEAMVGEGRRATTRYGWVFLMWGLIYFAAMGWMLYLPAPKWAWPVSIAAGLLAVVVVATRQRRAHAINLRARSLEAVWTVMGVSASLMVVATLVSHHGGDSSLVAAILFMVGMAHGTSAWILRWTAQWLTAGVWWACGIATLFFTTPMETIGLFLTASFFGMVLFGISAMVVERRGRTAQVQRHA